MFTLPPRRVLDARFRGHDELFRKVNFPFRHSRENGNPVFFPDLDSRVRGNDKSLFSSRREDFHIPEPDTKVSVSLRTQRP